MHLTTHRAAAVAALRTRIAAIGRVPSAAAVLPFGVEVIDRHLPAGGLALGAMHEVHAAGHDIETAAAPALFAAGILARRPGPVLWISRGGGVFAHGLLQAGLDPARVVFAEAGGAVLPVMEEALRHPGLAGVVGELEGALSLTASRRLQLAAEGSEVLGILIRHARRLDDPALAQPSAATTRWRVATLPSPPALAAAPHVPGLHRPLWRLDLLRCRGGEAASWTMEGTDAQGRLALAAVLAHGAAAPTPRRAAG